MTGVELSAVALETLCMERGIPARRRCIRGFDIYESSKLTLFRGNLFALSHELMGTVSAVYDRAALISWAPQLRAAYVEQLTALTSAGTRTLLVTMEYDQDQMPGSPFSVSTDNVERLYGKSLEILKLGRDHILASEPRLRSRGVTELHQVCYRLIRF